MIELATRRGTKKGCFYWQKNIISNLIPEFGTTKNPTIQTEIALTPEQPPAPPPPPPPPPPKNFIQNLLKKSPLNRKTKRAKSVPENIHSSVNNKGMNIGSINHAMFCLF